MKTFVKDRLGIGAFLADDVAGKFQRMPETMQIVRGTLEHDILDDIQPGKEFPTELCTQAATLLHAASTTSQLFHELINLCTVITPPDTHQDHGLKSRIQELQSKLARMESHMSAGISELQETIRFALAKAPVWHIHSRKPHIAAGLKDPSSPKRSRLEAGLPFPSVGCEEPSMSIANLVSMGMDGSSSSLKDVCGSLPSESSIIRADTVGSPTVKGKIWCSKEPDAVALAKFTATAAAHNVRRVALALLAALCLVEREMQHNPEIASMLLGDRAKGIWEASTSRNNRVVPSGFM